VIGPGDLDLVLLGVAEQARRDREQAWVTYVQVPVEPRISHTIPSAKSSSGMDRWTTPAVPQNANGSAAE
jgi:hypothetical protein